MSTELINDLLTLSLTLFFASIFYRFFYGLLLFLKRESHHKYCDKKKHDKGNDPLASQKIMFGNAWIKEYEDKANSGRNFILFWFIVYISLLIAKHL